MAYNRFPYHSPFSLPIPIITPSFSIPWCCSSLSAVHSSFVVPVPLVVFRLVEEVKLQASSCQLQNEDIYMNTTFHDFIQMCVRKLRGEDGEEELVVNYVGAL